MQNKKKWLVALIAIDETQLGSSELPEHAELLAIPERIEEKINSVADGVKYESIYLLTEKQERRFLQFMEERALHYHYYAVEVRGEHCRDPNCQEHDKSGKVIRLHDRYPHAGSPARPHPGNEPH